MDKRTKYEYRLFTPARSGFIPHPVYIGLKGTITACSIYNYYVSKRNSGVL